MCVNFPETFLQGVRTYSLQYGILIESILSNFAKTSKDLVKFLRSSKRLAMTFYVRFLNQYLSIYYIRYINQKPKKIKCEN